MFEPRNISWALRGSFHTDPRDRYDYRMATGCLGAAYPTFIHPWQNIQLRMPVMWTTPRPKPSHTNRRCHLTPEPCGKPAYKRHETSTNQALLGAWCWEDSWVRLFDMICGSFEAFGFSQQTTWCIDEMNSSETHYPKHSMFGIFTYHKH